MSFFDEPWFKDLENAARVRPHPAVELPPARRSDWMDPAGYLPDAGLADAIRVALVLRKPLLLTGEPGTGKTDCARYVAWKLGYELRKELIFEAKTSSEARDLFYIYDTMGRFQAMQTKEGSSKPLDYIHYNAMGEAFLQSRPFAEVRDCTPEDWKYHGPTQSVVLIDEIDKAPRDFPNDLLNEIDRMYFKIPELGNRRVEAVNGKEPVVIITSNSEKNLPPAFLRRCVYYHIPHPKQDGLERIVCSRLKEFSGSSSTLLTSAIGFFEFLREGHNGLQKAPSTAELLDWLVYLLQRGANMKLPLKEQDVLVTSSLVALLKHEQDQNRRQELWKEWTKAN